MALSNYLLHVVSDLVLQHAASRTAPYAKFCTKAHIGPATVNSKVYVDFYKKQAAAEDLDPDAGYSGTYSTTGQINLSTETVTLDKAITAWVSMTDPRFSGKNPNVDMLVELLSDELSAGIMAYIGSKVVAANYTFSVPGLVALDTEFDFGSLKTMSKTLNGRRIKREGRFALVGPDYMDSLAQDTQISTVNVFGDNSLLKGTRSCELGNFEILEAYDIPANSVNMVGFYGRPEALLVGTGYIEVSSQGIAQGVQQVIAAVPGVAENEKGLQMTVTQGYSFKERDTILACEVLLGAIPGDPDAIDFIQSAAP